MSQVTTATRRFAVDSAISQFLRVKLTAGVLALAGASDVALGTMDEGSVSTDEAATVRLRTAQGTRKMVASEAITAGNPVYGAASGKVAASGTIFEGTALEAAAANGDVIEVLPGPNTDIASSISGTSASSFEVDNDGAYPSIALASQTGGTGDFKYSIKPPATLTAARVGTLVGDGDAHILTNYLQSLTPNSSAGAGNSILAGVTCVTVGTVANNADDFIVLPAIADVPIGHTIVIGCNAGGNFEMRTPASSNTKINDVDSDGTQEYLCTDTDLIIVRKHTATGWVAQSLTKLGAVRTAVVPD